jgi:protein TonB
VGEDTILRVGGEVSAPVAVTTVQPIYPEAARRARIQGTVVVQAIIDQTGLVTEVQVLRALPLGLDQAAADAIKKWKFKPATLNGRPVAVYFVLTVRFNVQ